MRRAALLLALVLALAGCGGSSGGTDSEMVWCVGPGETVTAEFEREYPELYMDKAACDAVNASG